MKLKKDRQISRGERQLTPNKWKESRATYQIQH